MDAFVVSQDDFGGYLAAVEDESLLERVLSG
jgi:hypothetical protein